ncbi:MAG: RNA polymerase subunit sigma-70 [Xanthomonas sp.]|nr:RNA polymerase subunit sigma-70 [Xanthomonas sp.]
MNENSTYVRQALSELLPRLRRGARALTGSVADADDLVQTTVERALRHIDSWEPGTHVDRWVMRIMKNAWIDETRARSVRRRVHDDDAEPEAIGQDGLAQFEARMDLGLVERAMATLPDEQRLAIMLVLVEGLSYKEAAEIMEVPMGTLTSRLARGRTALDTLLRPDTPQRQEQA